MFTINKKYHFYAAHRNPEGGEKCGRIHGHTYEIECDFTFNKGKDSSITCLFSDIDALVEPILKGYCHYFLLWDQDPLVPVLDMMGEEYKKLPFITSAENLCVWFATRIVKETGLPLTQISLAETKSSKVIYKPREQA